MTQKQTLTNYQLSLFRKLVLDEVQALLIEGLPRTAEVTIESYAHDMVTVSDVRQFIEGFGASHKIEAQKLIVDLSNPGLNDDQLRRIYALALSDIRKTLDRGFIKMAQKITILACTTKRSRAIRYLRSIVDREEARQLLAEIEEN